MMIHEITPQAGRYKKRKRVGRGPGSGLGKTAGRGHKGAKSRSGYSQSAHEGGQMQFFRRIPKRGFSNARFRQDWLIVNVNVLEKHFDDGAEVTPETLAQSGLIPDKKLPLKVLGQGDLTKKLTVVAAGFSKGAEAKITGAGGSVRVEGSPRRGA